MNTTKNNNAKLSCKKSLLSGLAFTAYSMWGGAYFVANSQEENEDETKLLNTVTVTSTKRELTLQDVPVAVSVIGDETLLKAEIQDLNDLQSLVPSLRVGQFQSTANTNFIIRGFGNGANNAGIEPSVGVFIDGVYRSRSASQIQDLPNLQRIEVLRGPQSTLFGKNASAGVISVITRKPLFETQGSVEASLGSFGWIRLKGDTTGALSETVAYSVSGNYNKRDGYADDLATGTDTNQRNRYAMRGQLLINASENLELRLIADSDSLDEICCVAANLIDGPTGNAVRAIGGKLKSGDPFSYEVYNNFDSTNEISNSGISLQADWEFDRMNLTSITAYRTTDAESNQDSDFHSADTIGKNHSILSLKTLTQEFRLTSNDPDSQFDWMVGLFYFDESVEIKNDFQYGEDFRKYADALAKNGYIGFETSLGTPAGTFGRAGTGPKENMGQDNTAWSLFGTLDYQVSDKIVATLGLSYTNDSKDAYSRQVNTDVFSNLDLTQIGYSLVINTLLEAAPRNLTTGAAKTAWIRDNATAYATLQQQAVAIARNTAAATPALPANPLNGLRALQFLPKTLDFPNSVEDGSSEDTNTSFTLRLAYDVNENINVYGSYSTGFKATSWNLSRNSRPFEKDFIPSSTIVDPNTRLVVSQATASSIRSASDITVPNNLTVGTRYASPEEAKVIEIGIKGAFEEFAYTAAIFDQTIEGFQSNVFYGTGFALANAGEQSAKGIEFEGTWTPDPNLTLTMAATFLDPVYDSFVNSASGDISGQTPSGIPKTSTSFSANYDFRFNNWDSFIRGDWQYVSDTDFFDDPANNTLIAPGDYSREQNLVNASWGFITDEEIEILLWARNLFGYEYITTAFPSVAQAGSISGYPNQPRTYGLTVRRRF